MGNSPSLFLANRILTNPSNRMPEFARVLVRWRRKRRLSQRTLALAIGMSRDTVRSWERRRRTPSLRSLLRLSKVLKVRLDQLV